MPPFWFFAVMSFVMGIVCGSFFNVIIYRVPAKKSIVWPGSHCYVCGSFIHGYDNVPLLSYLWLRGTCRACGTHFSSRYFWIELFTGLLFLAVFWKFGLNVAVPFHWAFVGLLLIGTFTDIDHFIIPDSITLGGLGFALVAALIIPGQVPVAKEYLLVRDFYHALYGGPTRMAPASSPLLGTFLWALASAALAWFLLWAVGFIGSVLFRKEAMGAGDVKLFAFLGAYLGAINCIWVLFLSSLLGSVLGLTLLAVHKLVGKDEYEQIELLPERSTPALSEEEGSPDQGQPLTFKIARRTSRQLHQLPFGPYIAMAAVLVLFFQDNLNEFTRAMLLLPPMQTSQALRFAWLELSPYASKETLPSLFGVLKS